MSKVSVLSGGAFFGSDKIKPICGTLGMKRALEAADEFKKANQKVYAREFKHIAVSDEQESRDSVNNRIVSFEVQRMVNDVAAQLQNVQLMIDNILTQLQGARRVRKGLGNAINFSDLVTSWNQLIAKVNPLARGRDSGFLTDDDFNALHQLIRSTLGDAVSVAAVQYAYISQVSGSNQRNVPLEIQDQILNAFYRPIQYTSPAGTQFQPQNALPEGPGAPGPAGVPGDLPPVPGGFQPPGAPGMVGFPPRGAPLPQQYDARGAERPAVEQGPYQPPPPPPGGAPVKREVKEEPIVEEPEEDIDALRDEYIMLERMSGQYGRAALSEEEQQRKSYLLERLYDAVGPEEASRISQEAYQRGREIKQEEKERKPSSEGTLPAGKAQEMKRAVSFTRTQLGKMRKEQVQQIASAWGVGQDGNKVDIIDRILRAQQANKKKGKGRY